MTTLLQFAAAQTTPSDPRYRWGLARVSDTQPAWVPADAGLVDHLFLLFGLVESLHPTFFAERVMPALKTGDFNFDGVIDAADYSVWRDTRNSTTQLAADATLDGLVNSADYNAWRTAYGNGASAPATAVPEPKSLLIAVVTSLWPMVYRPRQTTTA
jgi:hypothetical protein